MKNSADLDRIREDLEAKQRATVWPDTMRNGRSIDAFLWKGDPNAKPVQRIGLLLFAVCFLFLAFSLVLIGFQKRSEDGSIVIYFFALIPLLISLRFLRNVFRRTPRKRQVGQRR